MARPRRYAASALALLTLLTLPGAQTHAANWTHTAARGGGSSARGAHGTETVGPQAHVLNSTHTSAKGVVRGARGAETAGIALLLPSVQVHAANLTSTAAKGGTSGSRGDDVIGAGQSLLGPQAHGLNSTHKAANGGSRDSRGDETAVSTLKVPGAQASGAKAPGADLTHTAAFVRGTGSTRGDRGVGMAGTSLWTRSPATHSAEMTAADHSFRKESKGRDPGIREIQQRQRVIVSAMRWDSCSQLVQELGLIRSTLIGIFVLGLLTWAARSLFTTDMVITIFYILMYCAASPMAIIANKILMKDKVRTLSEGRSQHPKLHISPVSQLSHGVSHLTACARSIASAGIWLSRAGLGAWSGYYCRVCHRSGICHRGVT